MNHIEVMSQLRNGIQYQECNKQIKRKEIKLFIFCIIIILLCILFYIFLPIFSNLTQTINENSDLIDTVENAFLYLACLIFCSILFIKLSKILKNYLNYYFINNWKRICFIFLISFALFICTIASIMTKFIFDINESKMIGNTWSYEDYARVLFLLLSLSVNICRTLCNSDENPETLTISSKSNIHSIDYEVNDEYMRNYKLTYLSDQASSKPSSSRIISLP